MGGPQQGLPTGVAIARSRSSVAPAGTGTGGGMLRRGQGQQQGQQNLPTRVVVVTPLAVVAVLVCASLAAGVGAYLAVLASRRGNQDAAPLPHAAPKQEEEEEEEEEVVVVEVVTKPAASSAPAPAPSPAPVLAAAPGPDRDRWKAIAAEASALFKAGDLANAAERFRAAITSCGDTAQLHGRAKKVLLMNLATCLQKLGDYADAEQVCSDILEDEPGMPEALALRARARRALGRDEAALVDLLVRAVLTGGDQNSPTIRALYAGIVARRMSLLDEPQEQRSGGDTAAASSPGAVARSPRVPSSSSFVASDDDVIQPYLWRFYWSCFASDTPGGELSTSELQIVDATIASGASASSGGSDHGKVHALTQRGYHFKMLGDGEAAHASFLEAARCGEGPLTPTATAFDREVVASACCSALLEVSARLHINGQYDEAVDVLQRARLAVEDFPNLVLVRLGAVYADGGHYEAAEEQLQAALHRATTNEEVCDAHLHLAQAIMAGEQDAGARSSAGGGGGRTATANGGTSANQQGGPAATAAAATAVAAAAARSTSPSMQAETAEAVLGHLREAIVHCPEHSFAHLKLLQFYMAHADDVATADMADILATTKRLAARGRNPALLASCAEIDAILLGEEAARATLDAALQLDPLCTPAVVQRAVLGAAAAHDPTAAVADLLAAIEADPGSQQAHLYLARVYVQQGATDAAERHFTRAAVLARGRRGRERHGAASHVVRPELVLEMCAKNIAELQVIQYINRHGLEAAPL